MGTHRNRASLCAIAALIFATFASAQQTSKSSDAPKQGQGGGGTSDIQRETEQYPEAAKAANDAMSMPGMDMNPHMFMTELQPKGPDDDRRAEEILDILRRSISKYKDYKVALADGYQIFLPKVQQPQYHFTNWRNAMAAQSAFDPTRPTSLLYKKTADGYELIGAMYTAPRSYTLAQLDARVPLSVAHWHEHVNFCKGPATASRADYFGSGARFGLKGSIATADACQAAGGTFIPIVFNWMVHVYPYEHDAADVWKVGH